LQMPFSHMMTQNAEKHVLVVGVVCHLLAEVDVAVFRTLCAGVFRPTKEDELVHLMKNSVTLSS
jgi:hypothetical protein